MNLNDIGLNGRYGISNSNRGMRIPSSINNNKIAVKAIFMKTINNFTFNIALKIAYIYTSKIYLYKERPKTSIFEKIKKLLSKLF